MGSFCIKALVNEGGEYKWSIGFICHQFESYVGVGSLALWFLGPVVCWFGGGEVSGCLCIFVASVGLLAGLAPLWGGALFFFLGCPSFGRYSLFYFLSDCNSLVFSICIVGVNLRLYWITCGCYRLDVIDQVLQVI